MSSSALYISIYVASLQLKTHRLLDRLLLTGGLKNITQFEHILTK